MDLELAKLYGTPGASTQEAENLEKNAQVELFVKLAAENNIDVSRLSDDQLNELWFSVFPKQAEFPPTEEKKEKEEGHEEKETKEEEKKEEHEKEETPAEEKKEEESKKEAAALEFESLTSWKKEAAQADKLGRIMAHAYVQELGEIGSALDKQAQEENPEGHYVRRTVLGTPMSAAIEAEKGKKLKSFGKAYGHGLVESAKGLGLGGAAGAALGGAAGGLKGGRAGAKKGALLGAALGAELGGVAGGLKGNYDRRASEIHGEYSKHKHASAIDELAGNLAIEKAAEAGWDLDEAVDRINAVYTLGLGDSEKVAMAQDVDGGIEIRSLEFLEAAGYPVEWDNGQNV